MSVKIAYQKTCRICQSTRVVKILTLPQMPLTDEYVTDKTFGKEFLADIDIYFCEDCQTVQTLHNADLSAYYDTYHYSVAASKIASQFMEYVAASVLKTYFDNAPGLKVLEVGSGDGEQLRFFKEKGCRVLGYEPSAPLVKKAEEKGVPSIQGLFDSSSISKLPADFKKADIILLSYTFDHLPEPFKFLEAVSSILDPQTGLLVIEVHDLEKLLSRREYCLLEHEHTIYLTRATAQMVMEKAGLTVIDFDLIPESVRRANSLIFIATPKSSRFSSRKTPKVQLEQYNRLSFYTEQADKIKEGIKNLDAFIEKTVRAGKSVAGYGAGGRAIMTLAATSSAGKMKYLIDKKLKGEGIYSPKSHLPVYGLDHLKKSPVDEVIVFSYGYMKEILEDCLPLGYSAAQFKSVIDVMAGKWN
ncbi:MAG: methyltransferase domain-containing protein [Candidatus Omnitrophica bacterium]|nr:methyltransferase domain-containing protein [Candidatus Omnitrophota bacterium]